MSNRAPVETAVLRLAVTLVLLILATLGNTIAIVVLGVTG